MSTPYPLNPAYLCMYARSEAFRGALILLEADAISRPGFNGPYTKDTRQEGFVSYGISHLMKLIGTGEMAQRSSWYQKWNVHMFPRPEVRLDIKNNVTLCVGDYRGIVRRESSLDIEKLP